MADSKLQSAGCHFDSGAEPHHMGSRPSACYRSHAGGPGNSPERSAAVECHSPMGKRQRSDRRSDRRRSMARREMRGRCDRRTGPLAVDSGICEGEGSGTEIRRAGLLDLGIRSIDVCRDFVNVDRTEGFEGDDQSVPALRKRRMRGVHLARERRGCQGCLDEAGMKFVSVRNESPPVSFREALLRGIAPDGGLYVPEVLPKLSPRFFERLSESSLQQICAEVLAKYIDEIPAADLDRIIEKSLSFPIPLVRLEEGISLLELFHGPTLAFKDVGARFMAETMSYFL